MKISYCRIQPNYLFSRTAIEREQKQFIKIAFAVHLSAVISAERYRSDSVALKSAVLNFVFLVMLKNKIEQSAKRNSLLKNLTDRTFENRWSRYKELGKKVPQAYRVYVEDTFLPCDAGDARIFSKEETGLYYYGARYLDPKYSRWLSGDPALNDYIPKAPIDNEAKKHNENLPGMGGVFNVVNLHVYHYAGNNPVKYIDPDGKQTKGADLNLFSPNTAYYDRAENLPNTFDKTFVIAGHGNTNGVYDYRSDADPNDRHLKPQKLAEMIVNDKMFNIKKIRNNGKPPIIMLYACKVGMISDKNKKIYAQELANELATKLGEDVIVKAPEGAFDMDKNNFGSIDTGTGKLLELTSFKGTPKKEMQE